MELNTHGMLDFIDLLPCTFQQSLLRIAVWSCHRT